MRSIALILLLVVLLMCCNQTDIAQTKGEQAKQTNATTPEMSQEIAEDEALKINTILVTVPTSVIDRNGRYVTDLDKEDFRIFENSIEQPIAYFTPVEQPFTVVLMLDVSGSTIFRLEDIATAANTLLKQLRPNDQMLAIAFDGQIRTLVELSQVQNLRSRALTLKTEGRGTRLYDAVDSVLNKRLRHIPGRKAIVLFTDGVDTTSFTSYRRNIHNAEEQDVLIYPIQFNTFPLNPRLNRKLDEQRKRWIVKQYEEADSYLQSLAQKTGGRLYEADNYGNLEKAFTSVIGELGRQYSLGYYLKAPFKAGERRQIKVVVQRPDHVVKARNSYVVPHNKNNAVGPK